MSDKSSIMSETSIRVTLSAETEIGYAERYWIPGERESTFESTDHQFAETVSKWSAKCQSRDLQVDGGAQGKTGNFGHQGCQNWTVWKENLGRFGGV